jgi:outer membrane receptor protein involved in Fe transport
MRLTLIKKWLTHVSAFGGLATLVMSLTSGSAAAQEEEALEEITVTGSRIARDPNLSGALPVQSVGEQEIQMSGEFSITDVVNDVPALLTSITSEGSFEATEDNIGDGANILNLRGLGANRTLVLVDGRRHVGGVQGAASVDVGSIPMRLVERVEVLTGGASAIYGADAVTGVVNFILKDNYEGFNVDASYGISSEGDGAQTAITATWGKNFANDRGNFAISVDWRTDDGLEARERDNGVLIGTARDWVNPDLRFQPGEISAGGTPLFEEYYNYANTGLIHYGLTIPDAQSFIDDYNLEFGTALTTADLSAGELALIDRGATAPARAVLPGRTFPFTSGYGYIAPGNAFTFNGFDTANSPDLDGNGVPDCADSFTGWFGNQAILGGCWNVGADGGLAPVQDGLVASGFQGFGGDSLNTIQQPQGVLLLPDDKISVNLLGSFDMTDSSTLFGEVKYVTQETEAFSATNSFWDLLLGAPDNPFIPAALQQTAIDAGGISITVDPTHFDQRNYTERETFRAVLGIEGEFDNSWGYEISANYGRFESDVRLTNAMINDRFFAAIDAVTDPVSGDPACRVEVDPTAPATNTPFEIPAYEAGYYSFTPGAGQCVPLDIWSGRAGVTPGAADFVTVDQWDNLVMDQFVLSAFITGDTSDWFEMPAGAIAFAAGLEYRDESSDATFDPWQRGVIPAGAVLPEGSNIGDVSANSALTFRPQIPIRNEKGSYDVTDFFLETSIPLLADMTAARELTLEAAVRLSDYSTIGETTTWKTNLIYAPVDSLSFRGTYSEAVRAPNINELFGPELGTSFRPVDPCDFNQIEAIRLENPTLADNFQNNCIADLTALGVSTDPGGTGGYSFVDPLSASFGGIRGGNPLLTEETAETFTYGFVFQPDFLEGFSLTADYWDISIDDAIESVSSQNIVDGCYQGATLNAGLCDLFTRNPDNNSPQAGGFTFLRSTSINFAKVETSGIDFSAKYTWDIGEHAFDVTVQGTKVNEIDFFTNPNDLNDVNPELGEMRRPEFAGNIFLSWEFGNFGFGWQTQYQDEQLLQFLEIETASALYGPIVTQDEYWQHDINARWYLNDQTMVYGGVRNLTDEKPFITERAFPASARGTFFFIGVDWEMM